MGLYIYIVKRNGILLVTGSTYAWIFLRLCSPGDSKANSSSSSSAFNLRMPRMKTFIMIYFHLMNSKSVFLMIFLNSSFFSVAYSVV